MEVRTESLRFVLYKLVDENNNILYFNYTKNHLLEEIKSVKVRLKPKLKSKKVNFKTLRLEIIDKTISEDTAKKWVDQFYNTYEKWGYDLIRHTAKKSGILLSAKTVNVWNIKGDFIGEYKINKVADLSKYFPDINVGSIYANLGGLTKTTSKKYIFEYKK